MPAGSGGLDLTRREFALAGVASLASLPGSVTAQSQDGDLQTNDEFQSVAVLEGPRDARPAPDGDFFGNSRRRPVYYAYRYVDEVTKASWYITQDLDAWHPEPVGAADATANGGHATALVSRDGDLYVRRWV